MSDENKCPKIATFSYLWPGKSEISYCCSLHMAEISAVGQTMGYPIKFSILSIKAGQRCGNTLADSGGRGMSEELTDAEIEQFIKDYDATSSVSPATGKQIARCFREILSLRAKLAEFAAKKTGL